MIDPDFKLDEEQLKESVIEESFKSLMQEIAAVLDKTFNPTEEKKAGFALFVFDKQYEGKLHYVSNVEQDEVLSIIRPFVEARRMTQLKEARRK